MQFLGRFLERLSRGGSAPAWLGLDTLPTTRQLFNIGIWLFAVAMAYPYLPGAETDAFKGLSVLLGLMVSLGASVSYTHLDVYKRQSLNNSTISSWVLKYCSSVWGLGRRVSPST